jgi:hypothetical protein
MDSSKGAISSRKIKKSRCPCNTQKKETSGTHSWIEILAIQLFGIHNESRKFSNP